MTEMSATELQSVRMSALPEISPATNEDVIAYYVILKMLKLLFLAEREAGFGYLRSARYFYF